MIPAQYGMQNGVAYRVIFFTIVCIVYACIMAAELLINKAIYGILIKKINIGKNFWISSVVSMIVVFSLLLILVFVDIIDSLI